MLPILNHPENRNIIGFLTNRTTRKTQGIATPRVLSFVPLEDPRFGIHPDAVKHFWLVLPALLPTDCKIELLGFPALVNPTTHVVFGVAFGFNYLSLRLPAAIAQEYCPGEPRSAEFPDWQVDEFRGLPDDWTMLKWGTRDQERCLASYRLAAGLKLRTRKSHVGFLWKRQQILKISLDAAHDAPTSFVIEETRRQVLTELSSSRNRIREVVISIEACHVTENVEDFKV